MDAIAGLITSTVLCFNASGWAREAQEGKSAGPFLSAYLTIPVSELGVLSKAPRKELFLAREEILGVTEVPGHPMPRGAILVTANAASRLLIPRWIGGYGACLNEIQALGIPTFAPLPVDSYASPSALAEPACRFLRNRDGPGVHPHPDRGNSSMDRSGRTGSCLDCRDLPRAAAVFDSLRWSARTKLRHASPQALVRDASGYELLRSDSRTTARLRPARSSCALT
jgi:hypothetical protein